MEHSTTGEIHGVFIAALLFLGWLPVFGCADDMTADSGTPDAATLDSSASIDSGSMADTSADADASSGGDSSALDSSSVDGGDSSLGDSSAGDASRLDSSTADGGDASVSDPGGPACATTSDCMAISAELECDSSVGRCIPGGSCAVDLDCASGESCMDGHCRADDTLCRFAIDCAGGGGACVDGRCLEPCSGATCGGSLLCLDGFCVEPPTGCACLSAEVCDHGGCRAICTSDATCGAGNFCDRGACHFDDRRTFRCADASECAAGYVCDPGGRCAAPCPGGTDAECLLFDSFRGVCDAANLCRSPIEITPQCARDADCSGGDRCVNAACRSGT